MASYRLDPIALLVLIGRNACGYSLACAGWLDSGRAAQQSGGVDGRGSWWNQLVDGDLQYRLDRSSLWSCVICLERDLTFEISRRFKGSEGNSFGQFA